MGCKGQRRREKNFQAAHGGTERLPPPPNPKELEALPSKLLRIMELMNRSTKPDPKQIRKDSSNQKSNRGDAAREKKIKAVEGESLEGERLDKEAENKAVEANLGSGEKKKRKRKRKDVKDLRFQELDAEAATLSRKARKKEYLDARKKKHKKVKEDDIRNFPGREEIRFGDIVNAPPKLSFPKGVKTSFDASQERVRLQAIEAYRNRRGWESRPGIQLPTLPESLSS